jgi:hypothetical protein
MRFFRNSHIGRGGGGRAASNQSGKSSGESEGSPDEQLFAVNNRRKPGQLTDNLGKQRYWEERDIGERTSQQKPRKSWKKWGEDRKISENKK